MIFSKTKTGDTFVLPYILRRTRSETNIKLRSSSNQQQRTYYFTRQEYKSIPPAFIKISKMKK